MMKADIIEKLKSILSEESISNFKEELEKLEKSYSEASVESSEKVHRESGSEDGAQAVSESELDKEFEELLNKAKERLESEEATESSAANAIAEEKAQIEAAESEEKELLSANDVQEEIEMKAPVDSEEARKEAEVELATVNESQEKKNASAPIVEEKKDIESGQKDNEEVLSESDISKPEQEPRKPGKEGILDELKKLLENEDMSKIKQAVKDLKKEFRQVTKAEIEEQKKQWEAFEPEEGEEKPEFEAAVNPLDTEFETLMDTYGSKVKEHAEKLKAEREKNLVEKKKLLSELETLVKNEENIGKMFSVFNELQNKWNDIGHIPGEVYHDVQDRFHRLKDEFYYNVDIYKQLKEHDLHVNEKHKQELIEKIREVKGLKSIKEREVLVKTYQREWMDLGPSPRETYKEMADEFFGTCRQIFDDIQKHYDQLHAEQEENLEKKKALVKKMEELLALEIKNHGTWKKKTDEVIELQKEWKKIGFAPREHNESVWEEFRTYCDSFFDTKREFYEKRREEQNKNKARKEVLVEKAQKMKDSDDWKDATKTLISLQDEWKEIGPAAQKDEQRLWQSFRAACDTFFNRKKEFFDTIDDRQEENLEKKNALIEEIEKAEMSGDKEKDIVMLKEFSQRFNEIGFVPKKNLQEVYDRYNKALDEKYDKLNLDRHEKSLLSYKQRVDSIQDASDSDHLVRKEKRLLYDKIDRLKQRVIQYENNMEFLSGDGAVTFIKEYEKKITNAKREIEEIKEKLDMLP